MTPVDVSAIAQTVQQFSSGKSNPSPLEERSGSQSANADLLDTGKPSAVDTVSISEQSREKATNKKKEEPKTEASSNLASREKPDNATAKVQFVYNPKGDLSVRYMDSANRLIYQVPSELMMRLAEALSKSDSSVDTRA